jgi:hypothetical protein
MACSGTALPLPLCKLYYLVQCVAINVTAHVFILTTRDDDDDDDLLRWLSIGLSAALL